MGPNEKTTDGAAFENTVQGLFDVAPDAEEGADSEEKEDEEKQ